VPGKTDLPADSPDCKEPIATCDALIVPSASFQVKKPVEFHASASAQYGATINGYSLDFGDGDGKLVSFTRDAKIIHTYVKEGTYTVKMYAETSLGQKTSAACQKNVIITPEPVPCPYDSKLTIDDSRCKPCLENPKVPETDKACVPKIVKQKKVANATQKDDDFSGKTAKPGDTLVYTLTTRNVSNKLTQKGYIVEESIIDILDYADVVDLHGGKMDNKTKVVSWAPQDIAAGTAIENKITVKVKDVLPATPVSTSDPGTFDLKMVNVYGDTVTVNVPCAGSKCVEIITTTLPNTGPGTSAVFGFTITAVVGYFFARSRIMARELEYIREDYAPTGGIA
jgi:PKD repeat protein